ncbi:MAG: UvrB/UvrC motif-containing protein [Gemmatimonadaceae bacterium]|nr:UvrB/UvrC motif-containing protein [Gemmatimonadaceae bacterium]
MLCDNCHERDAVVHLTQIENSSVTQIHLCERCAAERGVETTIAETKHPLGELLHSVQAQMAAPEDRGEQCAFCGSTMADFRATGRWGCGRCYVTFESSMRGLLRRLHGSSQHVGEAPQVPRSESVERVAKLGELRERLRRAIDAEQFELAADLRDRIRVLE